MTYLFEKNSPAVKLLNDSNVKILLSTDDETLHWMGMILKKINEYGFDIRFDPITIQAIIDNHAKAEIINRHLKNYIDRKNIDEQSTGKPKLTAELLANIIKTVKSEASPGQQGIFASTTDQTDSGSSIEQKKVPDQGSK